MILFKKTKIKNSFLEFIKNKKGKKGGCMDWDNALNDFKQRQQQVKQHSPKTIEAYMNNLKAFSQAMIEMNIFDPQDVRKENIDIFLNNRSNRYTNTSQNQMISTLRQFYQDYATFHSMKHGNPCNNLKVRRTVKKLPNFLTEQEITRFLDIPCDSHENIMRKAIFECMYSCGLRVSELVNLDLSNLHLTQNVIRFMGKGSKERFVVINDSAIESVSLYLQKVRPDYTKKASISNVFIMSNGKPFTRIIIIIW